jgi:hypothetical protein
MRALGVGREVLRLRGVERAAEDQVEGGLVLGVLGFGEAAGEAVGLDGEEFVFEGLEESGLCGCAGNWRGGVR